MSKHSNKLLLALTIFALVITPMRGAWALAAPADTDTAPHCAEMDMPDHAQHPDTAAETGHQDHQCNTGCNGDCCDGSCNACAHSVVSLLNTVVVPQNLHGTSRYASSPANFPHRTVIPPLRPPASL
jgi:hypothetical protein